MYTINDDYQPVNAGNYLAEDRANTLLQRPQGACDRQNYALCRESQPHVLFLPCTCCYGALQEDPLATLDDLRLCPDCGTSLASCHAQSN